MKPFLKNIFLFTFICFLVGELLVRYTHAVTDLPRRKIDEYGIQKYYPSQSGYWKGGKHKWVVNELGWPGVIPDSFDNLITIIGDSYIENFMNPIECHQSVLLKQRLTKYNFIEAGRSGVSFIEAMEISKQFDTLHPKYNLIYINSKDFYESITSIRPSPDITQLNLESGKIVYGKIKSPGLKKVLYNCKILYYFYNRFFSKINKDESLPKKKILKKDSDEKVNDIIKIQRLLNYTKQNYQLNNKILVFHPKSDLKIVEMCKKVGFKIIKLDSANDKSWTFDFDSHWSCYGHSRAADQIQAFLTERIN